MGEEKEILLHGKVCAYLTGRLMGDPTCFRIPMKRERAKTVASAVVSVEMIGEVTLEGS
jgi:hypothetical protein